jgi:hypothetical protein
MSDWTYFVPEPDADTCDGDGCESDDRPLRMCPRCRLWLCPACYPPDLPACVDCAPAEEVPNE